MFLYSRQSINAELSKNKQRFPFSKLKFNRTITSSIYHVYINKNAKMFNLPQIIQFRFAEWLGR